MIVLSSQLMPPNEEGIVLLLFLLLLVYVSCVTARIFVVGLQKDRLNSLML